MHEVNKRLVMNKNAAELVGTFWLVLGGCGSAVLAAAFPGVARPGRRVARLRPHGVDDGLRHRPHQRLAVSIGLWAGGRFPARDLLPYIAAQVLGAVIASAVRYVIASGKRRRPPRVAVAAAASVLPAKVYYDLGAAAAGAAGSKTIKVAGAAEASMEMKPPVFMEVGAATSDAEARRVDIARQ